MSLYTGGFSGNNPRIGYLATECSKIVSDIDGLLVRRCEQSNSSIAHMTNSDQSLGIRMVTSVITNCLEFPVERRDSRKAESSMISQMKETYILGVGMLNESWNDGAPEVTVSGTVPAAARVCSVIDQVFKVFQQ